MKITLSIIVFCLHSILFSQQIEELNRILKIDSLKLHENEIRIYKKYATSTALEMFRLYNAHVFLSFLSTLFAHAEFVSSARRYKSRA